MILESSYCVKLADPSVMGWAPLIPGGVVSHRISLLGIFPENCAWSVRVRLRLMIVLLLKSLTELAELLLKFVEIFPINRFIVWKRLRVLFFPNIFKGRWIIFFNWSIGQNRGSDGCGGASLTSINHGWLCLFPQTALIDAVKNPNLDVARSDDAWLLEKMIEFSLDDLHKRRGGISPSPLRCEN